MTQSQSDLAAEVQDVQSDLRAAAGGAPPGQQRDGKVDRLAALGRKLLVTYSTSVRRLAVRELGSWVVMGVVPVGAHCSW
jgi:hypothetical protein